MAATEAADDRGTAARMASGVMLASWLLVSRDFQAGRQADAAAVQAQDYHCNLSCPRPTVLGLRMSPGQAGSQRAIGSQRCMQVGTRLKRKAGGLNLLLPPS